MSNTDNPYNSGLTGGGYSTSYGAAPTTKPTTTPAAGVVDTTTTGFNDDVIAASSNHIVLVDFWAPWCGPCKQLGPVLEKVVSATDGKAVLVKMDIEQYPEIAGQMGIKSIPAVVAFVDGKPVDAIMGAVPEAQIKAFIDKLPSPANPPPPPENAVETSLENAEALVQAGDSVQAAEIYAAVLANEPGNLDAIAGMGTCYLAVDELELARNIVSSLPDEQIKVPVIAAFLVKLELAEQSAEIGPVDDLEKKVEADPKDHQSRFDLALALNAQNKRQEAADRLLEIIRVDRKWNEDGAREQLVKFFDVWGPGDPATLTGRRGLSSILFS